MSLLNVQRLPVWVTAGAAPVAALCAKRSVSEPDGLKVMFDANSSPGPGATGVAVENVRRSVCAGPRAPNVIVGWMLRNVWPAIVVVGVYATRR